jgi:uncharacterized membrane protein YfcA
VLIGLSLGSLGAGGSILTVPVLVYLLGQRPHDATTASLVIVDALKIPVTATAVGLLTGFSGAAVVGCLAGNRVAARLRPERLTTAFALLLVAVAGYTVVRSLPHLL